MVFEPATSRKEDSAGMIGRMVGGTVRFQSAAIDIGADDASSIAITFTGARSADPRGADLEQSETNYLLGNNPALWRTHVPNYGKVVYSGLYQGIDAVFYGNGDRLEHDFIVKPGADYRQIRMHFPANAQVRREQDGALGVMFEGNSLKLSVPFIYQVVHNKKRQLHGGFRLQPDGDVGFALAGYDPHYDLIIDPVLDLSTYLSPLGSDGVAIATDAVGNSYVTGNGSLGYPVTAGAFSGCGSCSVNVESTFVSKLSADGSRLLYSTVLGGNSFAQPTGIAVDANGNAIVSGWTGASNFPTKLGQPILPQNNNYVGFLVSLSPDGSSLNYGTLLSSSPTATRNSFTYAAAVTLDNTGNAYVTGETGDGFYISSGALNQATTGISYNDFDVFLVKFSPTGDLLYSAILGTADPQNGGGGPIGAEAVAVDLTGAAYVTGQAGMLWPITPGAYLGQIAGPSPYAAPFVMKVAPDAKSVVYSTFLDSGYIMAGISALPTGNVWLVGNGAGTSYPTTSNAYEPNKGNGTSFLTELNASGSALVYSTMICGGDCSVYRMALDAAGDIWLASQTSNPSFPLKLPLQSTIPLGVPLNTSGPVSVLSEFDPTGQTLLFSTFLGGTAAGYANGVAIDPNSRVHISGAAAYGMFTTAGAYASSVPTPGPGLSGSTFAYVALVDPTVAAPGLCVTPNTQLVVSTPVGSSVEQKLTITSCGVLPLSITGITLSTSDFSVPDSENNCIQSLNAGESCTFNVRFTPTSIGSDSSILTIASNSPIPATLPLTGNGINAPFQVLSASALTFNSQLVGTQSAPQTVTLSNKGSAALNGIGLTIVGNSQSAFSLANSCGPTLAAGATCTFSVAFKPVSAGTSAATLVIQNTSGAAYSLVSLTGNATASAFLIGTQPGGSTTSTVTAGSTATYMLSLNPSGGYSGTVNLSCNGLPANASCNLVPSSLTVSNGTPASFTLSISTQSTKTASLRTGALGVVFAGLLLLLPMKGRRQWGALMLCCLIFLLLPAVSGCSSGQGGSSSAPPEPQTAKVSPGTYTVGVMASDTSGQQMAQSITLIVQ